MAENGTQAAGTRTPDFTALVVRDLTEYMVAHKVDRYAAEAWANAMAKLVERQLDRCSPTEPAPVPLAAPELVWVPNGDGWYARSTDNQGTYTVTHVSVSGIDSSVDYWRWKYEDDDGDVAGSSAGSSSGAAAKHSAQRHETERVRAAAWADYMRDNNPPTT